MINTLKMQWQRLRLLAAFVLLLSTASLERAARLCSWIRENGGHIHEHCAVDKASYGYGLYAEETISPGSLLCAVPSRVCISAPADSSALDSIAIGLCQEVLRSDAGFFAPFVDILPKDTSYIPACYDDDRLQSSLAGTSLSLDARAMRREWDRAFDARPVPGVSRAAYTWARSTLQGRAYRVDKDVCFIPFITFANHDDAMAGVGSSSSYLYPTRSNGVSHPKDFILLQADRRYTKGQQILTSYGSLSFQQKLLSFGYLDRASTYSITTVDMPGSASGEQIEIRTPIAWGRVTRSKGLDLRKELSGATRIMAEAGHCSRQQAAADIERFLRKRLLELKSGAPRGFDVDDCTDYSADDNDDETIRKVEIKSIVAILKEVNG